MSESCPPSSPLLAVHSDEEIFPLPSVLPCKPIPLICPLPSIVPNFYSMSLPPTLFTTTTMWSFPPSSHPCVHLVKQVHEFATFLSVGYVEVYGAVFENGQDAGHIGGAGLPQADELWAPEVHCQTLIHTVPALGSSQTHTACIIYILDGRILNYNHCCLK